MNGQTKDAFSYNCLRCGGMIHYDIKKGMLVCESCEGEFKLELYERPAEEDGSMDVVQYRCPQCGAALHTTQTNVVGFCSFCGAETVFTERIAKTKRPDKIVPFSFTREQCESVYRMYMGLPKDQPLKFMPVYVPFYWYREEYEGHMTADFTRISDDTKYIYEAKAKGSGCVEGEMECASCQMEVDTANKLMFSIQDARPFSPAYLCGFYAEAPDLDDNREGSRMEVFAEAQWCRKIIDKMEESGLCRCSNLKAPPVKSEYVELYLMPVWLLTENHGQRLLYTAVSGTDGTIVCDKPINNRRVLKMGAAIAAIIFVVLLLLENLIVLRPNVLAGIYALMTVCFSCFINCADMRLSGHKDKMAQRRKTKRCSVMDGNEKRDAIRDGRSRFGNVSSDSGMLIPCVISLICLLSILFGLFGNLEFMMYISMISPIEFFGALLLKGIRNRKKKRKEKKRRIETLWQLVIRWLLPCILCMLNIVVMHSLSENVNSAVAGMVSDNAWFPVGLCAVSFIGLLRCQVNENATKLEKWVFYLQLMLVGVAGVLVAVVPVRELHYAVAVGLLSLMMISVVHTNRTHNDHVTRPVPYFHEGGRRECDA